MNKFFCTECGAKHEFAASKPKFCSECGYAFGGVKKDSPKRIERTVVEPSYDDDVPLDPPERLGIRLAETGGVSYSFEELYTNPSREGRSSRGGIDGGVIDELQRKARSHRNAPVEIA
jgi:hypothetical protein